VDISSVIAAGGSVFNKWMPGEYWLTRFVFVRALGAIYFIGFLVLFNQWRPLIGSRGLLPAQQFIGQLTERGGGFFKSFFQLPTIFFLNTSDWFLMSMCIFGLALSFAVMAGLSNGISLLALWIIYMSFVHIGQVFYGFGWESILLESGFLAIFLYPFFNLKWFPAAHPPPKIVLLLLLWVLFRVMLGAGLIKLRGHPCWKDLTCLFYHFETQPIPNPLSRWFHHLPKVFLKGAVLFNHFVELIVPFFLFGNRSFRMAGGFIMILFQLVLIFSGNLSWLNYMTMILCIPCFDDRLFAMVLPKVVTSGLPTAIETVSLWRYSVLTGLTMLIGLLSVKPTLNLFSPNQAMNTSYDPFHLVNTYGAFGSIGKVRNEVVIQGTNDDVITEATEWKEYEFKAKPGDPERCPPIISPYHYRLDWQIWFAAMSSYQNHPWLLHLIYKMLQNDQDTMSLIYTNPFKGSPPKFIRVELFEYRFPPKLSKSKAWWSRKRVSQYLPPLSMEDESFKDYLRDFGWI